MIAWDRVEDLKSDLGVDGFEEVVEAFFEEMDERFETMKEDDARNWEEDLHFLRGCAANLGFSGLSALCHADKPKEPDSIAKIEGCYRQCRSIFRNGTTAPAC